MNTLHRQKVQTIPLTEDLKTLTAFIICNMNQASTALREHPMACDWTKLAKLTMCRLILFNKRRRAEVKDLKVDDYETRPNWQDDQSGEFEMALSSADKLLASRYVDFQVEVFEQAFVKAYHSVKNSATMQISISLISRWGLILLL
ncbi:hypothetical protein KP79_PYT19054 [Mizuhopecten yessoensis]|uniref:Uncharacterized protein n=1 Tax=Mizuhopecten yessoensis TaxID=6573 RepID=A0A210PVM9_MIZYE|nr:hypothetical protein KP79_PYT19054 [Mizuhopecten yessoensis]